MPELDIEAIHKALANPMRRQILLWLKHADHYFPEQTHLLEHGVCAGQIDARCNLAQSTVSAHLAALQKANLIIPQRIGQWIFYLRNEPVIQTFLAQLAEDL